MDERSLRQELVELGLEMYRQDFISGAAGNISVRLSNDRLLITPSGLNKGKLTPDKLLVIDLEGNCLNGDAACRPSCWQRLHIRFG